MQSPVNMPCLVAVAKHLPSPAVPQLYFFCPGPWTLQCLGATPWIIIAFQKLPPTEAQVPHLPPFPFFLAIQQYFVILISVWPQCLSKLIPFFNNLTRSQILISQFPRHPHWSVSTVPLPSCPTKKASIPFPTHRMAGAFPWWRARTLTSCSSRWSMQRATRCWSSRLQTGCGHPSAQRAAGSRTARHTSALCTGCRCDAVCVGGGACACVCLLH
jgi:hypothetical protein